MPSSRIQLGQGIFPERQVRCSVKAMQVPISMPAIFKWHLHCSHAESNNNSNIFLHIDARKCVKKRCSILIHFEWLALTMCLLGCDQLKTFTWHLWEKQCVFSETRLERNHLYEPEMIQDQAITPEHKDIKVEGGPDSYELGEPEREKQKERWDGK